jgi:N4-gp56 family major capsid protein
MASTTKSTVTAQIPQWWSTRLLAQAENMTFWGKFEGPEGSSMPIVRMDELTKAAGDTIKLDMVLALTGAGVTGDTNALTGNEEALKFRQLSVTVSDLAHAVRWTELTEALINHDMRTTALNQLQKWLAGKLDAAIFSELTGGGTAIPAINTWFAGSATSINTLADTDAGGRLKLTDISDAKAYAQSSLKIEPMKTENGEEYYGLVLHPYTLLSLKKDTNYQQAQRDANIRGDNNPLFTGAAGVWDGVILYSSNRVPAATNANTPAIQYGSNVLFGAQALGRAFAQYPDWREEFFDYGRSAGVATTLIKGEKLSVFDLSAAGDNSGLTAIGSLVLYASAVAPVA